MRTLVIGDIHGNYKGLMEVLQKSAFDYENDTLISLGDIVDGWGETFECVEELLKIKNLIHIRGNHDKVFEDWIRYGRHEFHWVQGADATAQSYIKHSGREDEIAFLPWMGGYKTNLTFMDIPESHRNFFETQHNYYLDTKNRLFVHGGFNRHAKFKGQDSYVYYWDRDLWLSALAYDAMIKGDVLEGKEANKFKLKDDFAEIFIGHTATTNWGMDKPMKASMIWNLDTGACWNGKLTIMDVDTHEYWQSELAKKLYPNEKGRG